MSHRARPAADDLPDAVTEVTSDPADAFGAVPRTGARSGQPGTDQSSSPSRRSLLRTAGLVALAGGGTALAACSTGAEVGAPSPSPPAPSPPAPSSPAPSSPASSTTAPSPSASASSSPSATPIPKGPAVAAAEVPVGSGVILNDADYVVTQPARGDYKAFSKICTHNRCPVTEIEGDQIICRCHGSRFSIADGSVTNPPARKALPEARVTVVGGQVVVTG